LQGKKIGETSPSAEGEEAGPLILFKTKILARSRQKGF